MGNIFLDLRQGKIEVHEAATLAKLADTMITSSKIELEYNKFSGNSSKIEFMETKVIKTIEGAGMSKRIEKK